MRCGACPVPPGPACHGEAHPPACGYVAAGRADWAAKLVSMATGAPMPAPAAADVRAAMAAELCIYGSGPCGCSGPPRLCSRPDRPLEVWRAGPAGCVACTARDAWEAGVEPAW